MALYTRNKKVIEISSTDEGIDLISKKIIDISGGTVNIDRRPDVILIQSGPTLIHTSNTVMISQTEICVNPISEKNGNSASGKLMNFIEYEMLSIIRDDKLDKILKQ